MSSQQLYSRIAWLYDAGLFLNGYKSAARWLVRGLSIGKDALEVLDAGCGTGLYSIAMLKEFPNVRVTAFDLNADMASRLEHSAAKLGFADRIRVHVADAMKPLPCEPGRFDGLVAGGLLEYVDIFAAVRHLAGYLKPAGWFFNSPVRNTFGGRMVGRLQHFQPYPGDEPVRAFTEAGFDLVKEIPLPMRYVVMSRIKTAHFFRKR